MAGPLRITNCEASEPDTIVVTFSEPVFATQPGSTVASNDATNPANYKVGNLTPPAGTAQSLPGSPVIRMAQNNTAAIVILDATAAGNVTLTPGRWIQIQVDNVTP